MRQFLDLSTSHLPPDLGAALSASAGVLAYEVAWGDLVRNWWMWVPNDIDEAIHEALDADEPVRHEVVTIWRRARSLSCDYVLFDPDAGHDNDLPTWPW